MTCHHVASHVLCRPGYRPLLPSQAVVSCAYLMTFLSQKGAQQGQCCASCFLPVLFFWCFQTTFIEFLRDSQQFLKLGPMLLPFSPPPSLPVPPPSSASHCSKSKIDESEGCTLSEIRGGDCLLASSSGWCL